MTSTTQILFNSPALHSLKRDQLVKLCKHHSLKANGKNGELIDRLKRRATELTELGQLPEDGLEENEDDELGVELTPPRRSEQWEMVMDDIEEVDETNGTLTHTGTLRSKRSAGEFGTTGSKCESCYNHSTQSELRLAPFDAYLRYFQPRLPHRSKPSRARSA